MGKIIIILIILGLIVVGYFVLKSPETKEEKIIPSPPQSQDQPQEPTLPKELILTSPAFGNMEKIPVKYTCDGQKINPPLKISGVDDNAKSLVLIMDDPDAPGGTFDHWLKFNISPSLTEIKEGIDPKYIAPCPPDREHRYFFKLYSLDAMLDLKEGATKSQIESAMSSHILQQTALIGLYERK